MEVDEVEAGLELDALVAERVMGWRRVWFDRKARSWGEGWHQTGPFENAEECRNTPVAYWQDRDGNSLNEVEDWLPSEDMAAAWEVAEQVSMKYRIKVGSDETAFAWWCEIGGGDWRSIGQKSAALAICKAALKCLSTDG